MRLLGIAAFVSALGVGIAAQQPSPKPIDYESLCKLPDHDAKSAAFFAMTAENRGDWTRTQLERWRDGNRARLDEKQLSALDKLIAAISPLTYEDGPKGEPDREKVRPLARDVSLHFTKDERQAMSIDGPCIAKAK